MKSFSEEILRVLVQGADDMDCVHCYFVSSIPYSEDFVSFVRKNLDKPEEILAYAFTNEAANESVDKAIILICQRHDNAWRLALVFDPINPFQAYELFGIVILENFADSNLSMLNADILW